MTSSALTEPQRYLEAQIRWRPVEIAFWLATLLPFVLAPNYLVLASQIAITALFALSLDLILGYAGIVSLGHAAYFGFGSYTAGLIAKWGWGEPVTGLLMAAAAAGVLGYVSSFIIARFRHLALIMITLGFGLLLAEAANSASWLTGGADGLQGVRMWKLFDVFAFDLYGTTAYSYSLAVLFLAFLAARPGRWNLEAVYVLFPRLQERRTSSGNHLSGGEQQMLAIARALMTNPRLLLLDEPLEGLAPIIVEELAAAIRRMTADEGTAFVLVEQHAEVALSLTDDAIVLERGSIVHRARSQDLLKDEATLERLIGLRLTQTQSG